MSDQTPMRDTRDRNLLFGVIAVQLHFISPVDLAKAAALWATDPVKDLGDVLAEMELIQPKDRAVIDQLLDRQIDKHGGDPRETLQSFGGNRAIHESFAASIAVTEEVGGPLLSFGGGSAPGESKTAPPPASQVLDDGGRVTLEHPGRYTIKGEHGRGGIGRVLIALDEHIGREVALKELLPDKNLGSKAPTPMRVTTQTTARFLREARITGSLEHPGIVPVYELGKKSDGSIYYTMKLVRGDTLHDRLQACKTLPERLKLLVHFFDLGQAIAYAHSKGVIHRDLKPQNVMVGKFGETVVLDWGLAKVKGVRDAKTDDKIEHELERFKEAGADQTVTGSPLGTPSYMSPEQAEGKIEEIDELSDVWSLGAVLYEILTGDPPYTGDNAYEVLGKVMTQPVKPVREIEPRAPAELCAICEKCLRREKKDRYQSASEVAEDVGAFQSGGLVTAYDYSMAALVGRWVRQRWPVLLTAGAALLVALVMAVGFVVRLREEKLHTMDNLAEAYFQYGLRAEETAYWNNARVYYAKALALTGRPDARMALYRESIQPLRLSLDVVADGGDWVQSASFAPSGAIAATGGRDKTIRVWSVENGKRLLILSGHNNTVLAVEFSPDGKVIASGGADKIIMLWSAATGDLIQTLSGHADAVSALAFSPDGRYLASGSWDSTAVLWSGAGEKLMRLTGHKSFISSLAFLPDTKALITASGDGSLKLWSVEDGRLIKTFSGGDSAIWSLAVAPDGKNAASGDLAGTVKIWSLEKGETVRTMAAHQGAVYGLAYTPDGKGLVSAGADRALKVWDPKTGELKTALAAHRDEIFALAVAKAGGHLITAGRDRTVRIWSFSGLDTARRFRLEDGAVADLSSDGEYVATATADKTITLWSLKSGKQIREITGFSGFVTSIAFSPDKTGLAAGDDGGLIKLCSLVDGTCGREFKGHRDEITSLAYSPLGDRLLAASKDGVVKVWEVDSGNEITSVQDQDWWGSPRVTWAPTGKTLAVAGSQGSKVDVLDVDGRRRLSLAEGDQSQSSFAFSPLGSSGATGGCARREGARCLAGAIRLWSLDSGKKLLQMEGHDDLVSAVAFSPDGTYLVSGGADGSVILWSAGGGKPLMTFPPLAGSISQLAFTADGSYVLCRSDAGAVAAWPMRREIFEADPADLFQKALTETGLKLQGFNLVIASSPESAPAQ